MDNDRIILGQFIDLEKEMISADIDNKINIIDKMLELYEVNDISSNLKSLMQTKIENETVSIFSKLLKEAILNNRIMKTFNQVFLDDALSHIYQEFVALENQAKMIVIQQIRKIPGNQSMETYELCFAKIEKLSYKLKTYMQVLVEVPTYLL